LSWASKEHFNVILDVLSVVNLTEYGGESGGDGSQDPFGDASTSIVPSMRPVANDVQMQTQIDGDSLPVANDVQMQTHIDGDSSDLEFWVNEAHAEDDESDVELYEPPPKKVTCVIPK
jgi:hypothetical protein